MHYQEGKKMIMAGNEWRERWGEKEVILFRKKEETIYGREESNVRVLSKLRVVGELAEQVVSRFMRRA